LFSMGFPFGFKPELLTEVFPPIKQFRSLGRFTWVFHALWMPFFVVLCFRLLKVLARRRKAIAWGVGMAICTLTISEGLMQWQSIRFSTGSQAPMMVQRSALPWLDEIPRDSYSCIVALPWFHVGSENLITTQTAPTAIAFSASLRTGLPLLNVMMSRTSLSQTWAQFQLATEPAEPLEILKSLPDKRPMLAIRQGIRDTFDGAYFKFGMGSPNHPNEIQTYPLDLWSAQKELLKPYVLPADSLLSPELFRLDFDADGDVDGMWGSKGKRLTRKDNHFLFQGKFPQLKPNQSVVVSCWARLKSDGIPMTYFGLELHDAQGNNVLWSYPTFNGYVRRIEGEWALVERLVTLPDAQHSLSVNITRWSRLPATIDIDELSIRLANRPSRHQKPSGIILVNNRKAGNLTPNLSSLP